jgi:hypothetical protein
MAEAPPQVTAQQMQAVAAMDVAADVVMQVWHTVTPWQMNPMVKLLAHVLGAEVIATEMIRSGMPRSQVLNAFDQLWRRTRTNLEKVPPSGAGILRP